MDWVVMNAAGSSDPKHPSSRRHPVITDPLRWLRNRSLPLLVLLLLGTFGYPWFDMPGAPAPRLVMVAFAAVPVFGVLTLGNFRLGVVGAVVLIAAILITEGMESRDPEVLLSGQFGLLVIAFYLVNIALIGRSVMKSDALLDDRVYGGVAVYLMIVVLFAVMHHRLGVRMPDAYRNVGNPADARLNWADFLYFSFATLTTTGFGDIVPANAFSRSLASVEAVVGVLYPAVLIARLVNRDFNQPRA
jgi:hypothetical protein